MHSFLIPSERQPGISWRSRWQPLREEPGVSLKTNELWLIKEDEYYDTKRKHSPRLESKGIQQITKLVGHTNGVTALVISPDDQILVSGDVRGRVTIWGIAKRTSFIVELPILTDALHPFKFIFKTNNVTSIFFRPKRRTFWAGCRNGMVRLWNRQTGELLHSIQTGHGSYAYTTTGIDALALSPEY